MRALAHKDGHDGDLHTFTDLGRSASEEKSAAVAVHDMPLVVAASAVAAID